MHFARTEEQEELAATIKGLLAKRSDSGAVRAAIGTDAGYDTALWTALCEQIGIAALAVPEEFDGVGASLIETAIVLEELGEALTPTPYLSSTMATVALLLCADDEHQASLLPRLAAGGSGALHLPGDDLVLDGDSAEILLISNAEGDLSRRDGTLDRVESMDQTLRFGRLDDGPVTKVGAVPDPAVLLAIRTALTTALQVGGMQRALDMTVGYSQERVQFGRQIGSFQALKHRMADMLVLLEASRSASWGATAAAAAYLAGPSEDNAAKLVRLAGVAGSYCSDAFGKIAGEMVQLHGGIAITWEHDAHLVFKRAHALSTLNGPAHRLRAGLLDQAALD